MEGVGSRLMGENLGSSARMVDSFCLYSVVSMTTVALPLSAGRIIMEVSVDNDFNADNSGLDRF